MNFQDLSSDGLILVNKITQINLMEDFPCRKTLWRYTLLYAGKISSPFYFIIQKGLYYKTRERANSRLGKSVSDFCRAKIRLGKFKAVNSILAIRTIKHTGDFDRISMAGLCFMYFSCTILSAPIAVSRMCLYFMLSSLIGFVSFSDGVRDHFSLNCSFSCLSDFSSSSSMFMDWKYKKRCVIKVSMFISHCKEIFCFF